MRKKPKLKLKIPGEHNVSNALAVLEVTRELKISDKITLKALSEFNGTWRRMEYRGTVNGAKIYDDYGHHPTEIIATLKGVRKNLLKGQKTRLWCVFQPHQYQRTLKLFKGFLGAFDQADETIILPIYSVSGREKESIKRKVNSRKLAEGIKKRDQELGIRNWVLYLDSFKKAKDYLKKNLRKGDVCIIMGAGDIYKLTEELLETRN